MRAFLFNRGEAEVYQLEDQMELYADGRDDEVKNYHHVFGGEGACEGTIPPGFKKPVHLFLDLDLSDPRVGLKPRKYARFLPLYYPLGNAGGPFRYRVVHTGVIEMYSQPYPPKWRAHAKKNYPAPFEEISLELVPRGYDPKDVHDVFFCGGVLGIDPLTKAQRAKLRRDFLKFYRDEIGVDLIADDYDGDDTVTVEEIVSGYDPFTQGTPRHTCPNPECKVHKAEAPIPVLAFVDPDKDDPFYKSIGGGDDGQLVWQYCEKCGGVVVSNPCT